MQFSSKTLTVVLLGVGAPLLISGFAPLQKPNFIVTAGNSRSVAATNVISPAQCFHQLGCSCSSCSRTTSLFMSEEEVTAEAPAEVTAEVTPEATEAIPEAVTALDGVESEEEAHNTDRPARPSGIQKHNKEKTAKISMKDLVIGSTVTATVKTITAYGAFLDLGATTDALLHVSRMSDTFVSNVADVINKGDEVQVRIVGVDAEKNQISVTMRSEEAEAAASSSDSKSTPRGKQRPKRSDADRTSQRATMEKLAAADLGVDTFVEGEVVSTLDFGAFVRVDVSQFKKEGLEGEIDGLVHISALMVGRCNNVSEVAKVGAKVQVRVKGVDAIAGKISLSMVKAEDEQKPRGGGGGGRGKKMFSDAELGPTDWKEKMEKTLETQPTFQNLPVIVDKRKNKVSA